MRRFITSLLEILRASTILRACRFTNFIARNASETAKSWSAPAIGKEPNVLAAGLLNFRRNCPPSLPQAVVAKHPPAAANPAPAECAGPVGHTRIEPAYGSAWMLERPRPAQGFRGVDLSQRFNRPIRRMLLQLRQARASGSHRNNSGVYGSCATDVQRGIPDYQDLLTAQGSPQQSPAALEPSDFEERPLRQVGQGDCLVVGTRPQRRCCVRLNP